MVGYLYDAEGQRVAKGTITSPSCDPIQSSFNMTEEIFSVHDGSQTVHFDGQGTWLRNDLYVSGQLIATYANDGKDVHYHMTDWLGIKRLTTASDGTPEMKCENGAFGDSLTCSRLANNANQVTDTNFTGKERDSESGLDYFGARYYGSSLGRFMNPDPSGLTLAEITNPQSFNLYAYVMNNPLTFVDLTGLDCVYLNNAGTGVEKDGIDHYSDQHECNSTGGYWAPGYVANDTSVHTSANTDVIGIDSTSGGRNLFSIANCSGCSTTNSDGSLMGAMTQTFGNVSSGDFSYGAMVYNVMSGSDTLSKHTGIVSRIDAWLNLHDAALQKAACALSPGTANETRDAMNAVLKKTGITPGPTTPNGNTDAGGASNIFMPNNNRGSNKGYGPMGSFAGDTKLNAVGTFLQYTQDLGQCLP